MSKIIISQITKIQIKLINIAVYKQTKIKLILIKTICSFKR